MQNFSRNVYFFLFSTNFNTFNHQKYTKIIATMSYNYWDNFNQLKLRFQQNILETNFLSSNKLKYVLTSKNDKDPLGVKSK